ncbi:hypothetical protein Tco_0614061 [Tanacetum coccineum]
MRRASKGYTGVNTPLFQTMLVQGQNVQGEGSTIPVESHHTPTSAPSTSQPQTSSPSMQTIHAAPMPHDSPIPRVHSLRSDKGSLTLNELTGRSLVEDMDLDDGISLVPPHVSDQGRFDDKHVSDQPEEQLGVFSATKVLANAARIRRGVVNVHTYTRRRTISTAGMAGVSTASRLIITTGMAQEVEINIPSPVATKDKGKFHEEEQARFNAEQEVKFNEEQEQERLDYEADDILARVAADEDLVQQLQVGEKYSEEDLPRKLVELVNQRKKFFAQQRAEAKRNKPMTPAQQKAYILKRAGKEGLEEPAKRQKIGEASGSVQEQSDEEPKAYELSQEQLQQLMIIVPEEGMNVEALQTKYPIIDWEVYSEDTINLVHERFNSTELTDDKAKQLWVELKRLFEPDENDTLWKIQRYMHYPLTWKLYDTCGVYYVSTERGHDIFMLVEKDYLLTRALMTLMLCNKLRVDEYSEMENDLLRHMDNVKMPFEDRKFNKGNRESQRFVIAMKLNKGLKDSNLNHECCILEATRGTCQLNKMMLERLTQQTVDPLAAKNRGAQGNNAVGCARGRELQLPRYATIARNCTQPKRLQNSEYFKDKMLYSGCKAQENRVSFADDYDAYDSDVDEAPTAQTMFMANLSSTDPVCDEAGPSYDSDILSEVQDHDHFQDAICEHHEEHGMQDDVQPSYLLLCTIQLRVGRGAFDSNMTSYDQYVRISQCPVDKTILYYGSKYMSIYIYISIYLSDLLEPKAILCIARERSTP